MSLSSLWAQHSPLQAPGSRLVPSAEVGLPSPCHHQPSHRHHCAPCNVTTTRPQQTAAPAVVCLLRVFLLTADLLFWASVVLGAGGAMQIIQKYAIIILRRSTAAQASANVSLENTNHLNGIYYLYRDSKTFLQILHNFHYCMKCQFLGEKIQN